MSNNPGISRPFHSHLGSQRYRVFKCCVWMCGPRLMASVDDFEASPDQSGLKPRILVLILILIHFIWVNLCLEVVHILDHESEETWRAAALFGSGNHCFCIAKQKNVFWFAMWHCHFFSTQNMSTKMHLFYQISHVSFSLWRPNYSNRPCRFVVVVPLLVFIF